MRGTACAGIDEDGRADDQRGTLSGELRRMFSRHGVGGGGIGL